MMKEMISSAPHPPSLESPPLPVRLAGGYRGAAAVSSGPEDITDDFGNVIDFYDEYEYDDL